MISHCRATYRDTLRLITILFLSLALVDTADGQDARPVLRHDYSTSVAKSFELQCPDLLYLGEAGRFQGSFANPGEDPIDDVTFSADVSDHLAMSDFQTSQGSWAPGTQSALLSMGTVAPGVTVEFSFIISTEQLGTATLTTQFSGASSESCNIEIIPPSGFVFALKYNDQNANQTLDEGEPFLEGWEFFLDENDDGQLDDGERVEMTDTAGLAVFEHVPLGTYGLIELQRDGWAITQPHGFTGYSVELTEAGQSLIGDFGNFQVPLHTPIATTTDHALYWAVDRFGEPMPDGTFDFSVTDVKGDYDFAYMNLFIDFNGDGVVAPYPVNKDSDQLEWPLRNVPVPGTDGLTSNPRMSAWFRLPDLSLDLEAEYEYAFGLTSEPVEAPEGIPIELVQLDLVGTTPFMTFTWGDSDLEGQLVEDTPPPAPEPVPFPSITFVDDIPGPLDPNGMPDIAQKTNECGPTSSANSLIWLARKHNFTDRLPMKDGEIDEDALILELMQAMAGNQNRPFAGLRGDQLHDGKKKVIQDRNLPLTVEGGNTDTSATGAKAFEFIRNERDKGQDIELLVKWPGAGTGSHWVTVTGYAVSSEKKAVLFIHDPDDKKTAEVVWELEVTEDDMITGKVTSPSEARMLWAVAESPVANIGIEDEIVIPKSVELLENFPNPFVESTTIGFSLPNRTRAVLTVYDMLGRTVETLVDDELAPGPYEIEFHADGLSAGTYVYKLETNGQTRSGLMTIVSR